MSGELPTVVIKKGWYRSAGVKYGWVHQGYMAEGVGINRDALYGSELLCVVVNGDSYTVDTKQAIEFIRKWKSHYKMSGGTAIGVISRSLMKI